ncbi:hypothetical protein SAMN05880501_108141 [Ureibacillus xyleni]|uniref:Uncharacterized protein n=1 Tax=Ureibacillus xyleni TaxID=614648 RepID=A0A285T385_9BACL|nr:hypothetical protein [Ureibacillus xyleni]SOC15778.1 hypothetical protein SAMN05880501_108141 [Ureibacillus xyleni]
MIKVFNRIDYFLIVIALMGVYGGWKNGNVQLIDYILPLATIIFIYNSKRNSKGRGFSGFLAYFGTTYYFIGHFKSLIPLDNISLLYTNSTHILLYVVIGVITLICMFAHLTTYALTVTWTIYYLLLFIMIVSRDQIGEFFNFINSSTIITSIMMSYSSILMLSIIGGIFLDLQIRNKLVFRP